MLTDRTEPLQLSKALAFVYAHAASIGSIVHTLTPWLHATSDSQIELRLWSALPRAILGAGAQGAAGDGFKPIDLVLEATAPVGTRLRPDVFSFLNDALPATPFAAEIFGGTEHVIMPGDGNCALFCPLVRKADLSAAQFSRYWLDVHADFGRRDPRSRYRQLHASADMMSALAHASGLPIAPLDGVAEAYFTDTDELRSKLSSPHIAVEAYEDERRFIDHERSAFLPFERLI